MPFSMGEGALKLCNLFQTTTGEFPMAKKCFLMLRTCCMSETMRIPILVFMLRQDTKSKIDYVMYLFIPSFFFICKWSDVGVFEVT